MLRKLAIVPMLVAIVGIGGCAATYKPPVDTSQPGVSQAKHDADLADCRAQASRAALSRSQTNNPTRTFGSANPLANTSVTYTQNQADVNTISQPGGMQTLLDQCMQGKGYKLTN